MNKEKQSGSSVFWISLGITVIFILWGTLFTDNLATVINAIYNGSIDYLGWVYLSATCSLSSSPSFCCFPNTVTFALVNPRTGRILTQVRGWPCYLAPEWGSGLFIGAWPNPSLITPTRHTGSHLPSMPPIQR